MTVSYLKAKAGADGFRRTVWPLGDVPMEPLEIIAPYDGLANPERNRYYRQYTGLDYVVPVVVYGGLLPFSYELTTKPTGMSINASTGVITWTGANVTAGVHNVTAKVTDFAGNIDTVSWTITVGTTDHIFLDASAVSSGTGTFASPLKAMTDVYKASFTDSTFLHKMLWIRAGAYTLTGLPATVPISWANKPRVMCAYPGDAQPSIDFTDGYLSMGAIPNIWVSGLKLKNFLYATAGVTNHGFSIPGDAEDGVFYNCWFDQGGSPVASSNPSPIMFTNVTDTNNPNRGYRYGIMDCSWTNFPSNGAYGSYGVLGYDAWKVVVQRCSFTGFGVGSHPIGPKEGCNEWFMQENTIDVADGLGIWVYGGWSPADGTPTAKMYIRHNNIKSLAGYGVNLGESTNMVYGAIVISRNTIWGGCGAYVEKLSTGQGPVWFADNVLQFPSITFSTPNPATGDFRESGNLYCTSGQGVIDSSGNLQGAYARLRGIVGHQHAA